MDLLLVFKLLLKRKWYLIIIPLACAILSVVLTIPMKREYKSVAKLETRFTTDDRITVTAERFNSRDAEVKFNNLVETMSSELIVSMLSYRLALNDLTGEHPFRKADIKTKALLTPLLRKEAVAALDSSLQTFSLLSNYRLKEKKVLEILEGYGYINVLLERNLKIGRIAGSDFINVAFVSEDPFLSAYVVNTLCEESIRYDNYLNSKRAAQSIGFFSSLLNQKKEVMDERMAALDNFRQTRTGESKQLDEGDLEERKATILSNIRRLTLSIESIERRQKNSVLPNRQEEINSNIVSIRKKMDELNNSTKDATTQNRINELANKLQIELGLLDDLRSPGKLNAELIIEKEEKEIELRVAQADLASLNGLMASIHKNASNESALNALQRRAENASEEYLDILNRHNMEKSKALITSPLQLAIPGQPSEDPEFPKRYLVIAVSWLASLMICAFVIVIKEFLDFRIRTAEQLAKVSGLRVIAAIGKVDTKKLNLNELFVLHKRDDLESFKNQLRKLRYEIEESGGRVLLVTSTAANQGKSFLIFCLAYLLAMLKKKVLVIDTNFRHNSITQALNRKAFGQSSEGPEAVVPRNEKGVSVADQYPKIFCRAIMVAKDQFWIEAVGNSGSSMSPAEVLVEKDFQSTLNSLRKYYDYIIMEGPALNDYSDTRELSNYADRIIPVFSAQSSIKPADLESIEFLKTLNGKLAGAILNKIDDQNE